MFIIQFNGAITDAKKEFAQFEVQLSQFNSPIEIQFKSSKIYKNQLNAIANAALLNQHQNQIDCLKADVVSLIYQLFNIENQSIPFLILQKSINRISELCLNIGLYSKHSAYLKNQFEQIGLLLVKDLFCCKYPAVGNQNGKLMWQALER